MDQEIPLPPPRNIRHRSPAKALDQSLQQPKRPSRLSVSSFPSSDPAFFSSDDIPSSSLENYHGQQPENSKKRRYRGTWWGEKAIEPKRKRADFREKRHLDSGVWMGSDESSSECLLSSESSSCEDFFTQTRDTTSTVTKNNTTSEQVFGPAFIARNAQRQDEPKEHQAARALVNNCLDKGQDSVDLSGLGIRNLPSDLLRPLLHLTKQPQVTAGPITDEVFTSLTPFLRVFLSGNSLTQLTSEVFELGNLKVLSLRNNKLREIPGAIRRLTKLQEVNLSVNRLNTLPWEMLWLIRKGDLKHMIVRPNPLISLHEATDIDQWHYGTRPNCVTALRLGEYKGPIPEEAWAPIHIATSRVYYIDSEGTRLSDRRGHGSRRLGESTSRVPSLRELALLECNRAPYLDQFLEEDLTGYPELVIGLLRQARAVRDTGGMSCSVCHRSFVIPRTEWIEWWDCTTYENGLKSSRASGAELRPLPFLRRGCSWGCVPATEEHPDISQGNIHS